MRKNCFVFISFCFILLLIPNISQAESFKGIFSAKYYDDFHKHESQHKTSHKSLKYFINTGDENIEVKSKQSIDLPTGTLVRAKGEETNNILQEPQVSSLSQPKLAVGGNLKTAVILVNFNQDRSQPWTPAQVKQAVFTASNSTKAYYQEVSHGQINLVGIEDPTGDVFGWYQPNLSRTTCNEDGFAASARASAINDGHNIEDYDHVIYIFPEVPACGWLGLAELDGSQSWINGDINSWIISHELGHNFGANHASSLRCTSLGLGQFIQGSCIANEYGDPFDVMGNLGHRHHNAWHREQIGTLSPSQVQTVTQNGEYTLTPASFNQNGTKSIRVPRRATGSSIEYYYLEFRSPYGVFDNFSSGASIVNGISIRMAPDPSISIPSRLLDTNPFSSSFTDAALSTGSVVEDTTYGIKFETISTTPFGAVINIEFDNQTEDLSPPTQPTSVQAIPSPGQINLSWSSSQDNQGVEGYDIERNGVVIGSTSSTHYTDFTVQANSLYSYRIIAKDTANNKSYSSLVFVSTPANIDKKAPSTPTNLRYNIANGLVNFSWDKSNDEIGVVGYEVYRNGQRVSVTGFTSWEEPLAGLLPSSYTYTVKAYDLAKNLSASSNSIVIDLSKKESNPEKIKEKIKSSLNIKTSLKKHNKITKNITKLKFKVYAEKGLKKASLKIKGKTVKKYNLKNKQDKQITYKWKTGKLNKGKYKIKLIVKDTNNSQISKAFSFKK